VKTVDPTAGFRGGYLEPPRDDMLIGSMIYGEEEEMKRRRKEI